MFDSVSSVFVILAFASLLAYRFSFFHNRKIFRLSLLQILYLVVVPGIYMLIFLSNIERITQRPMVGKVLFSDAVLKDAIFLSLLYTYGGVAIHAVSKMMAETSIRGEESEAGRLNRYFHMSFSHNLFYSGALATLVGLTLLEINHEPDLQSTGMVRLLVRGVSLGIAFVAAMYFYTRSRDEYVGRWAELKATFMVVWLLIIIVAYNIQRTDPVFREYDLLLPMTLGLSAIAGLNLVLVLRRVKRLVGRMKKVAETVGK